MMSRKGHSSKKNNRRKRNKSARTQAVLTKSKTEIREDTNSSIVLDDAYVMRNGTMIDSMSMRRSAHKEKLMESTALSKEMTGSHQIDNQKASKVTSLDDIVNTPYNPDTLSRFLDIDPVHYRCVHTKVIDSIGGKYELVNITGKDKDAQIEKDLEEIKNFIEDCNDTEEFQDMLTKVDMDQESIGYATIEVVRSMDKKVRYLYHTPAARIRSLRGFTGYVERFYSAFSTDLENGITPGEQDEVYYQPFGEKVVSPTRKKLDGSPERYNPKYDGDISKAVWNLKDKKDLNVQLQVGDIKNSANEIIFIKKAHSKSAHYGVPDWIPALGALKGNLNIRDFFFQYFEHNAVPQYAVIVKGASLKDDVKEMIQEYFSTHVKGQHHSTLIIPIPAAAGGNVEVVFERLSAEVKEGSFQETKKNNQKDIIVAHGMTPAIIGIVEGSSLGSGKGTAQNEVYKNRIVVPRQARWERTLNKIFAIGLGIITVGIEFDDLDIGDKREQRENALAFLKDGVINRNEVRKTCKLGDSIEGGDRYTIVNGGTIVFVDEITPEAQEEIRKKREELMGEEGNSSEEDDFLGGAEQTSEE